VSERMGVSITRRVDYDRIIVDELIEQTPDEVRPALSKPQTLRALGPLARGSDGGFH
jgi:hypothetical protein